MFSSIKGQGKETLTNSGSGKIIIIIMSFIFFFLSKEEIIKEREGISQIILGFKLFLKDKFT